MKRYTAIGIMAITLAVLSIATVGAAAQETDYTITNAAGAIIPKGSIPNAEYVIQWLPDPDDLVISFPPEQAEWPAHRRTEDTYAFPDLTDVFYFDPIINQWINGAGLDYFQFEPMYQQSGTESMWFVAIPQIIKDSVDREEYIRKYYGFTAFSPDAVESMEEVVNQRIRISVLEARLNKLYYMGYLVTGDDRVNDREYMAHVESGGAPDVKQR